MPSTFRPKQIVLFNGPPKCGKDTMVRALTPYLHFEHAKFAAPLKRALCGLLNIEMKELEVMKDEEYIVLNKRTLRVGLIALSEEHCKPLYGEDFFGRLAANEARHSGNTMLLYSDCGFEPEVRRLVYVMGRANCVLVRLHRSGCDFSGDSRSHLPDGVCKTVDIHNDDTVHNVSMRCLHVITRHFNIEPIKEPIWLK